MPHLERARLRVNQAEKHVKAQRKLLHRLEAHGFDTWLARDLLSNFEETLRLMRQDLARKLKGERDKRRLSGERS